MTKKSFWILFGIAAALRVFRLWNAPLWYDENFTLILARLPFKQMLAATAGDVHPPLWYLIEWTIYHVAPHAPVWIIRLPALTFSLLALWMFVLVCDTLRVPQVVKIVALVLMAILPMQIWYAQEGRMYALLEFLVLATLYTALNRKLFWLIVSATAMLYTQNYGVFYLGVIAFVTVANDWSSLSNTLTGSVVAALLYSPWAFVVAGQMTDITGRYWIMDASLGGVLNAVYKQFWISAMSSPGVTTSYVATFAALIIGVIAVAGEKVTSWWIVLTMAFAPYGVAWIASMLWQPLLLFRPLIGTSPFLYLIVAWTLFKWWPRYRSMRRATVYASCFAVPLLMFGLSGYYINVSAMKGEGANDPLLSALAYVDSHWQPGDVIYVTDDGPMINLLPYTDKPLYRMPGCDAPVLGSLSDATRAALNVRIADLADVPHTRAWVFAPRSPLHPACYEEQIKSIAPEGGQLITVDDNEFITSGVWLVK